MMHRFDKRGRAGRAGRRLGAVALTAMLGSTAMGLAGCDTVAQISFSETRFQDIRSSGLVGRAGACSDPAANGQVALRFVLMSSEQTALKPGDTASLGAVQVDTRIMSLRNSAVFSTPDEVCATNADCGEGFVCATGGDSFGDNLKRCLKNSTVDFDGNPQFVARTGKPQYFAVLYENSGSLRGFLPEDVGRLTEVTDDGTFVMGPDSPPDQSRASDGSASRLAALNATYINWRNLAQNTSDATTHFGLWSFDETRAQVLSHVSKFSPNPQSPVVWTKSPLTAERARLDLANSSIGPRRADVYLAIDKVLSDGFDPANNAIAELSDADKTLVVFVDGPDDYRPSGGATAQSVAQKASQLGVRLFIVHLDAAMGDPARLRDDYKYYENQQPCASSDQCLNFEECRRPARFRQGSSGAPTYPADLNASFCMPKRDESGRLGPINDYSQIACETGGGYIYVPSNQGLRSRMEWLPHTMEGMWEVNVLVDAATRGNLPVGEAFKVQTDFDVTLGNDKRTYSFSQLGEPAPFDQAAGDTRTVLFTHR